MRLHVPKGIRWRTGADLTDLTASKQTGPPDWAPDAVDVLEIPFEVEPTPDEQRAIRRRLLATSPEQEARAAEAAILRRGLTTTAKRDRLLQLIYEETFGPLAE